MASIADITVFDGASTPVTHTLNAISVVSQPDGSVEALWRESLSATPAYANIEYRLRMETLKSGVQRMTARVSVPVMEAVLNQNAQGYTAAPKVAYVNTLSSQMLASPRSTVTDRRLARMILTNLMNGVTTSTVAATSGSIPDLFDRWVMPT